MSVFVIRAHTSSLSLAVYNILTHTHTYTLTYARPRHIHTNTHTHMKVIKAIKAKDFVNSQ